MTEITEQKDRYFANCHEIDRIPQKYWPLFKPLSCEEDLLFLDLSNYEIRYYIPREGSKKSIGGIIFSSRGLILLPTKMFTGKNSLDYFNETLKSPSTLEERCSNLNDIGESGSLVYIDGISSVFVPYIPRFSIYSSNELNPYYDFLEQVYIAKQTEREMAPEE